METSPYDLDICIIISHKFEDICNIFTIILYTTHRSEFNVSLVSFFICCFFFVCLNLLFKNARRNDANVYIVKCKLEQAPKIHRSNVCFSLFTSTKKTIHNKLQKKNVLRTHRKKTFEHALIRSLDVDIL